MSYIAALGDILLWALTVTVFVAYIWALFAIITDLFRDHALNGWLKAVWLIFLIFLPLLTALVYLIVRGRGMGQRAQAQIQAAQQATDDYIRQVAGGATAEIAQAKALLDSGSISQAEFEQLKARALAN